MTLSIDFTAEDILARVRSQFSVQQVYEGGVPTAETLIRNGDELDPYIVVDFGDLSRGRGSSFAGPRGDDYMLPVRLIAVAHNTTIARQLRTKGTDSLLGYTPIYAGPMHKRPGGGTFVVTDDNGSAVAYLAPSMFHTTVTLLDIGD